MHAYALSLFAAILFLGSMAAIPQASAKTSTEDFVRTASAANAFEVQSSKLALEKSQNKDIKRFAQRMVDDHTKTGDKLQDTLQSAGLDSSLASDKLDHKQEKIFDRLEAASGDDFNKQYLKAQTDAHKDAVKLFSDYARHGDNAELKTFASNMLPNLKEHLNRVEQLQP